MNQKQLDEFKQRLLEKKQELMGLLARIDQDLRENVNDQSLEGSMGPNVGADVFQEESLVNQQDLPNQTLREVNQALDRIEQGVYGLSEVSGKPIPL